MNPLPTNESAPPFHPKASNLSLVGAATSIICVAMKVLLQQNTSFVAKKYVCHDKRVFVAKKTFVMTNICCDTHVMTKTFCYCDKHFVITKLLSRQAYFCHDKRCVCCDKNMSVTTKILLSWQKTCFVMQTCACHDKTFVTTKMMHVAAPANDSNQPNNLRTHQPSLFPIQLIPRFVTLHSK